MRQPQTHEEEIHLGVYLMGVHDSLCFLCDKVNHAKNDEEAFKTVKKAVAELQIRLSEVRLGRFRRLIGQGL